MRFILFLLMAVSTSAYAGGLVIHSEEVGVGKFHRIDNGYHAYGVNAWAPFILDKDADLTKTTFRKNPDYSYTVFFITLEDLLKTVAQIAKSENQKVSVLNVHGHGLPGGMWFPKDKATQSGYGCYQWNQAAQGSDEANYKQYYEPVSLSDIQQMRQLAEQDSYSVGCVTGLKEWKEETQVVPEFLQSLSSDLQVHFLSCLVGLGKQGNMFTQGMADLLLNKIEGKGRIESSMNFGLGDWSMIKGMGFWDYQNDQQLEQDSNTQVTQKRDSLIAQKGSIRVGAITQGVAGTAVKADQEVMSTVFQAAELPTLTTSYENRSNFRATTRPTVIHIPGTDAVVPVHYDP